MNLLQSLSPDGRQLAKAEKLARKIEALGSVYKALSDTDLQAKTEQFRNRLSQGESLDDLLPEAFATAREAAERVIGERPYPVQLIGGILLHQSDIAEMKTGEGKTLTSILPVYLNALAGQGVHVVTVNPYLAHRDAQWMGQIYRFLGLTVGCNDRTLTSVQKRAAFACDITYTTNSELGFDYLRDNMVMNLESRVLRGLHFALVDEVDSVLVDEARTPLIISGAGEMLDKQYLMADQFVKALRQDEVEVDPQERQVYLSEKGIVHAERFFKVAHLYDHSHADLVHYIQQALKANYIMMRDVEYVVEDGEVIIVDQFTGRKMEGREFSDGLHQAIQAKEGVGIKQETKTLATITYQNFFRLYDKLAGMTGTAKTEEQEFLSIYNMRTIVVPTNKPIARLDYPDAVFKTKGEKYDAIVDEVVRLHAQGQPVLVGTPSVEISEILSQRLSQKKIPHPVLNAKNHAQEAEIIARAGQRGAVTIATNMAGRGTDIKLGEGVVELGGLAVLGTERHESKRIDNQLRGRAGRQGDPGFSRFYVSMQDDFIIQYASDLQKESIAKFCEDKLPAEKLRRTIDLVQKRAEDLHYDSRKRVLEYDDVLMEQRRIIFGQRDQILMQQDLSELVASLMDQAAASLAASLLRAKHANPAQADAVVQEVEKTWLLDEIRPELKQAKDEKTLKALLAEEFQKQHQRKKAEAPLQIAQLEKMILLSVIDHQWNDHVDSMNRLREGIYLRSYAQIKPEDAYRQEGFERFTNMMANITDQAVLTLLHIQKREEPAPTE
ncbi:preprotein translocase subunit SecA [Holdemania massiliensis]|uniref:Protein translocase subunit SecA n=1 Tax=Holdemania massiliensis TaxID=1468449 RepID=A0A6N7S1U8_9FIRM|nr:preprotein translocase subunit SecA [Holdemania massiliensis]MSA69620.1 preprotein translocase subunit SecA [Holdemania massiliensis]MSA87831.1 preprotein translocase subunit SecA [Holdemania massiliensis]MSB76701.1 preprotein translocase subunit SecA [Holdemania massiliensis]MSC31626.1 preprotein translocase subunit SecA [Holdemania massiliensis]MSC37946.1 preprotein translocase subunit SecA [Holdemania massiliensis]